MAHRNGRLRGLAVLGLLALALAGCGGGESGSSGDEKTVVDVGILGIAADAPIWAAIENGYFAEEGLEVRTHASAGGAAMLPAVVSGDYEVGSGDLMAAITAASKGLPVQVLSRDGVPLSHATAAAGVSDEEHLGNGVVAVDKRIRKPADLAGKKVAVATVQSLNTVMISAWLEDQGVDPKSVRFLEVPFPEMQTALEAKRVDAVYSIEPFLTTALGAGGHMVGWPIAEVAPGLAFAGLFVSRRYAEEHPDTVAAFGRAVERANELVDGDEAMYRKLIAANTKIPRETVEKMRLRSFEPGRKDSLDLLTRYAERYGLVDKAPAEGELTLEVQGG